MSILTVCYARHPTVSPRRPVQLRGTAACLPCCRVAGDGTANPPAVQTEPMCSSSPGSAFSPITGTLLDPPTSPRPGLCPGPLLVSYPPSPTVLHTAGSCSQPVGLPLHQVPLASVQRTLALRPSRMLRDTTLRQSTFVPLRTPPLGLWSADRWRTGDSVRRGGVGGHLSVDERVECISLSSPARPWRCSLRSRLAREETLPVWT